MKRLINIFIVFTAFSFVLTFPCLAGDNADNGFHKMYQNKKEISLYVNEVIGKDQHGHGRFPHKPFKTIAFALEAIPLIRNSPEFRATVYLAAGTYNENLDITIDNITLQGEGRDVTTITGSDRENVNTVNIVNSRRIEINDVKITNGRYGVNLTDGSSVNISSYELFFNERYGLYGTRNSIAAIVNTNAFDNERGMFVNRGSYLQLKDCQITSNREDVNTTGISVDSNGSARLNNGNTIFGNNRGINVQNNACIRIDGSNDTISPYFCAPTILYLGSPLLVPGMS